MGWLDIRFLTSLAQVLSLGGDAKLPGKKPLPVFVLPNLLPLKLLLQIPRESYLNIAMGLK